MGWKDWLGIAPNRDDFARDLAKRAAQHGMPGWAYDPAEGVLTHEPSGQKVFVQNSWLEYSSAHRTARSLLMEKYLSMMLGAAEEVPQLWEAAARNLYVCVRSRHHRMSLEIESRGKPGGLPKPVLQPWHGDIDTVLMYDFGQYLAHVTQDTAEPWGQPTEALFARARANLAALERPSWQQIGDGVFQLVSNVSYEESFVLVKGVWESVAVDGDPVVALPNRGVLLLTGSDIPGGLDLLIAEARRSMQERPWPLSAGLFRRVGDAWQPFSPDASLVPAARMLDLVSLANLYAEQQDALEKHFEREGIDIFVAKFDVLGRNVEDLQSWCTWSEGVLSLLPQTDVVILGRSDETSKPLIVPWSDVRRICGHYMEATQEDPPRFRVASFPTQEWAQLVAAGRILA
jgi:hypothetical protein